MNPNPPNPPNPNPNNPPEPTALLSQIPFGAIIGGPLKAAVDAQSAVALACYDFINKVGFDAQGNVKEATFNFVRDGKTTSITVPVLTIMPIPFLRIESLNLNFKVAISSEAQSSSGTTSSTNLGADLGGSVGFPMAKLEVKGSVSSKKDSTATNTSKYSVEHTIDISIHAVQDDMPAGLAKILSMLSDSIAVKPPQQG